MKKKKYKLYTGTQSITPDTPDYDKAYTYQAEEDAKKEGLSQLTQQFSGAYAPVSQIGGGVAKVIKSRAQNKRTGAIAGGAVQSAADFGALGMKFGGPWGAAAGAVVGGIYGGIKGKQQYEETKRLAQEEEKRVAFENYNKQFKQGQSTDAQSALAKKGKKKVKSKYKVVTKQPRLIETEGREPIFSPKKADGTRDLLYYNPNDPTHEEGGVKAIVVPKKSSGKHSLVRSSKMAYGAKQVKVAELNDASFSQNFAGAPAANAANNFNQPSTGISQVARQIPEIRRKEKGGILKSHRTKNPDINREIPPPRRYEEIPKDTSSFNNKNNFNKGSKYVKVYAQGSKGVSLAFSRGEKDPKGGLTQKGVDKYNRATGGNLKMAVTTPPSKLKPGSKAANRRKSFCARMSGVKGPMTKPNGEPSRKALALRKWNC